MMNASPQIRPLTVDMDDVVLGERSFALEAEVTYFEPNVRTIKLTYIAEYNDRSEAVKMSDADLLAFESDHSDWIESVIDDELDRRSTRD